MEQINTTRWVNEFCPFCEYDGKAHDSPSCEVDVKGGGFKCHGSCGRTGKLTEFVEKAQKVGMPLKHGAEIMGAYRRFAAAGAKGIVALQPISWDKVKAEGEQEEAKPIIPGLLPGGENAKLVIFGAPKEGKTTLGLSICVPASRGELALNAFQPAGALKAAYGNFEQATGDIHLQIRRMEPMYGLPLGGMFQLLPIKGYKLNRPEHGGALIKALAKGKFKLCFLDSINFGVDDNNETPQVTALIECLGAIVEDLHCAVIVTDHTKESGDRPRPWESPQPLAKLGHELERWAGSRLFYTDIFDSVSDLYGRVFGDIRGGIGKVDYAVAYTKISDSVQIVPWDSVPVARDNRGEDDRGAEIRRIRKSARVRGLQELVIFAEGLGYSRAQLAKALDVSDVSISNWIHGEKEPSDMHWLQIQQVKERLEKTGRL